MTTQMHVCCHGLKILVRESCLEYLYLIKSVLQNYFQRNSCSEHIPTILVGLCHPFG